MAIFRCKARLQRVLGHCNISQRHASKLVRVLTGSEEYYVQPSAIGTCTLCLYRDDRVVKNVLSALPCFCLILMSVNVLLFPSSSIKDEVIPNHCTKYRGLIKGLQSPLKIWCTGKTVKPNSAPTILCKRLCRLS